jgi:23S rRNA pseudouridine1911/1915/1917 synthase
MGGERQTEPLTPRFETQVSAERAGRTLSEVVRAALPAGTSWSYARELCKRGKVRRNGLIESDAALRVHDGDAIEIDLHAKRRREHVLDESALLYCDPDIVVVNKPAGLLSVPFDPNDRNTLIDRVRFLLRRREGTRRCELGAVQRLDKDTTGLLVFARTLAAKRELQQLFRRHALERRYLALAHGEAAAAHIDTLLVTDRGDGLRGSHGHFRRARGPAPREAQRAITDVRPLEALRGATLLECRLETGRQHQIRIHLSESGHPLIGEPVYIRDYEGPLIVAPRPMLHAAHLGFAHPRTQAAMSFNVPLPDDFNALLAQLRAR